MIPQLGSSDESLMPATLRATLFAKPIWPSNLDNQTYKYSILWELYAIVNSVHEARIDLLTPISLLI